MYAIAGLLTYVLCVTFIFRKTYLITHNFNYIMLYRLHYKLKAQSPLVQPLTRACVKARLHRRFLSRNQETREQFSAIFVALKLQLQNRV